MKTEQMNTNVNGVEHENVDNTEDNKDKDKKKEKKERQQIITILGINISHARCATHLKINLNNPVVTQQLKTARESLKKSTAEGNKDEIKNNKKLIADLSKENVRISSQAPIAVAVAMDFMVDELLRFGIEQAINNKYKIVEMFHLNSGDISELVTYPLFNETNIFKKIHAMDEKELKGDNIVFQNECADESRTKTKFITYIEGSIKSIKKEEKYSTIRISNKLREYISAIITETIKRITKLSQFIVQTVTKVRTMNADHIKSTVALLMIDGQKQTNEIDSIMNKIDKIISQYEDHVDLEKKKKVAQEDSEKLKKIETDKARKQLQITESRLIKANQKKSELEETISKLVGPEVKVAS
jgi:hypothetical protein